MSHNDGDCSCQAMYSWMYLFPEGLNGVVAFTVIGWIFGSFTAMVFFYVTVNQKGYNLFFFWFQRVEYE